MMRRSRVYLLVLAMLASSFPAAAEEPLRIPRASHAPQLDDYVAGVPADAGVEISEFRQNSPGDGDPVSLPTRTYLSYDDTHLYAVFVCKDDPKQMRARIARRDDIFGDEGVQLFLDTFHDKQRAYVFSANPYGVQMDSRLTEGLGYDFNFDTQWVSDGRITADGFIVVMKIPFKSLRFDKEDVQDWGIAVNRIIPRTNEFAYWPYITERKEGFVPQFAEARIEDTISPGRNIQVIPHLSYRNTRALEEDAVGGPRIGRDQKTEAGLDAKFVINDALAVDLTVNPDFGEVESDEPQIIVNKRFEVLFPEKRPFFLENASFFGTPVNLFFSRRIVDPEYGARITGRVGRWAIGGLLIDDEQAGLQLTGDDADETGRIGVTRIQRDFGTQSNIGMLLTDRRVGDHENRVLGIDSRISLNDNWAVTGQAVSSRTRDGEGDHRSGHLVFAQATRGGRHFTYDGQYLDVGRNFATELGFVPRTDIRQLYQTATYLWQYTDAPWLVSAGPTVLAERTWNQDNDLQDWRVDSSFQVNGLRHTSFSGHWIESYELYAGLDFRKHAYSLSASTEWLKWLTVGASVTQGDAVNYIPAAGLDPFLADGRQFTLNFTLSPFAQLRVDQNFIWDELRTREPIAGRDEDARIFRNTLSRTKVKYQFNRFLAAHVIFDYASLDPDAGLIALERGKRLTTDVLVSYSPNPGTSLYVGYTDQRENLRLFGDPRQLERTSELDLHTGRQFFVKLSYLFNF
jgi:hypothetical protein